MDELTGKRVWLTGASSGIGRAVALELAARKAVCVLTARNADELEKLREQIGDNGARAIVQPGDVTDAARMKEIATHIEQELGGIDILLSNAGTHVFTRPEEFDASEYLNLHDVNFGGMARCIEAVLPGMLKRKSGRIVGMGSLAGYRGLPRAAAYSASKSAIIKFLQSLRFHLLEHNIDVTIVNPGFVRTPLTDKNDFHMPFLIEADKAAQIICKGLARGKKDISFPIPFNWMINVMRILPYPLYEWIMTRVWNRTKKS